MSLVDLLQFVPTAASIEPRPLEEMLIHVKLVDGESGFRWYVMASDGQRSFHGIAAGLHAVIGDFEIAELEGLGEGTVHPDPEFRPVRVADVAREDPAVSRLLPQAPDLVQLT